MRDPDESTLKRLFQHMDRSDLAPDMLGDKPGDVPEGFEDDVEFDSEMRRGIPGMTRQVEDELDHAFRRAQTASAPARAGNLRRPLAVIAVVAAAAMLLFAILIRSTNDDSPLSIDFAILDAARSPSPGVLSYRLQAVLSDQAYWYVLERDQGDKVNLIFPFYDAASDRWDFLGHDDNRFDAGEVVVVPGAGSVASLVAEGESGATEHLFAVASREPVPLDELREIAAELERSLGAASASRPLNPRVIRELEAILRARFDAITTQTRTYE